MNVRDPYKEHFDDEENLIAGLDEEGGSGLFDNYYQEEDEEEFSGVEELDIY